FCTGLSLVTCPAPDQCHDPGSCDPATGVCSNPAKPNGAACDDGDACTETDACESGTCTGVAIHCTGNTPVCDVASGTCRRCNSDEDCSGTDAVCLPNGACGECLSSAHCATGLVCDVATNRCRGCTGDNDCTSVPNAPACRPSGRCGQCSSTNFS